MLAARMLLNLIGEDDDGENQEGSKLSELNSIELNSIDPNSVDPNHSDPGFSGQDAPNDHRHIQLGYQIIERESL